MKRNFNSVLSSNKMTKISFSLFCFVVVFFLASLLIFENNKLLMTKIGFGNLSR